MANIIQADAHPGKRKRTDTPRYRELVAKYPEFHNWLRDVRRCGASSRYGHLIALEMYEKQFGDLKLTNGRMLKWLNYLEQHFALKTVELRMTAINQYIKFTKSSVQPVKVKTKQKTFLENVVSLKEYQYLLDRLKDDGDMRVYFMLHTLGSTGVRAQELVMFQYDHVLDGHVDIRSKKKKVRRIYFPKKLRDEVQSYVDSGAVDRYEYVCRPSRNGEKKAPKHWKTTPIKSLTSSSIGHVFRKAARKYGVDLDVIYPHSFRHMFAKAFIAKHKDIALLADLLGHEDIETTRIYLRQTSEEQAALVDEVVTW